MFVLQTIAEKAAGGSAAVVYREKVTSYKELEEKSGAFASFLLDRFGNDKTPVVIFGHKEAEFLICMFGALKAGRAYVPIDKTFPPDRAMQIIEDVRPEVIVDLSGAKPESSAFVLDCDGLSGVFSEYSGQNPAPESWVKPEDNCYIMFTSGSTGKPKGVPINRRNLENLWRDAAAICDVSCETAVAISQASYSFDLSVISVYIAVGLGMTLFTVDKGMSENFKELFQALKGSDIAFWVSTPSFAELCAMSADFNEALLPKARKFFFCGEILTNKLAGELLRRFPMAEVINSYGPTEATVFVSAVNITPELAASSEPLPVGRFFSTITPLITGESGIQLPAGEKGELYIIGDSVSRGYFNDPERAAASFFDFETPEGRKRGYRTGDICCISGDMLHYCGRNDLQIKLSGYRIEIEDIEKNLMKLPYILRAAVSPIYKDDKVESLAAFAVLSGKPEGTRLQQIVKIKNDLRAFVPSYMVPSRIVIRDSLPTNANGKVDKKALLGELGL